MTLRINSLFCGQSPLSRWYADLGQGVSTLWKRENYQVIFSLSEARPHVKPRNQSKGFFSLFWFWDLQGHLCCSRTTETKCHTFGGLKQQTLIVSWFWRPEVWNQDVSRAVPSGEFIPCISPGFCQLLAMLALSCRSVQFSRTVVSGSLQPHGLQHAGLPCPSPTPRAPSN